MFEGYIFFNASTLLKRTFIKLKFAKEYIVLRPELPKSIGVEKTRLRAPDLKVSVAKYIELLS